MAILFSGMIYIYMFESIGKGLTSTLFRYLEVHFLMFFKSKFV